MLDCRQHHLQPLRPGAQYTTVVYSSSICLFTREGSLPTLAARGNASFPANHPAVASSSSWDAVILGPVDNAPRATLPPHPIPLLTCGSGQPSLLLFQEAFRCPTLTVGCAAELEPRPSAAKDRPSGEVTGGCWCCFRVRVVECRRYPPPLASTATC